MAPNREMIDAFVDGGLSATDHELMVHHISSCTECAAAVIAALAEAARALTVESERHTANGPVVLGAAAEAPVHDRLQLDLVLDRSTADSTQLLIKPESVPEIRLDELPVTRTVEAAADVRPPLAPPPPLPSPPDAAEVIPPTVILDEVPELDAMAIAGMTAAGIVQSVSSAVAALAADAPAEAIAADEPAETTTAAEPAATIPVAEPTETIAAAEPAATIPAAEPTETIAAAEPAVTITTEEPTETVAAEPPAETVAVEASTEVEAQPQIVAGHELGDAAASADSAETTAAQPPQTETVVEAAPDATAELPLVAEGPEAEAVGDLVGKGVPLVDAAPPVETEPVAAEAALVPEGPPTAATLEAADTMGSPPIAIVEEGDGGFRVTGVEGARPPQGDAEVPRHSRPDIIPDDERAMRREFARLSADEEPPPRRGWSFAVTATAALLMFAALASYAAVQLRAYASMESGPPPVPVTSAESPHEPVSVLAPLLDSAVFGGAIDVAMADSTLIADSLATEGDSVPGLIAGATSGSAVNRDGPRDVASPARAAAPVERPRPAPTRATAQSRRVPSSPAVRELPRILRTTTHRPRANLDLVLREYDATGPTPDPRPGVNEYRWLDAAAGRLYVLSGRASVEELRAYARRFSNGAGR